MQLIYGNKGVDYGTLYRSEGITSLMENNLINGYTRYETLAITKGYTSLASHPKSFTFVSTNLDGALKKEYFLLALSKRLVNLARPSYYTDIHLIEDDEEMFLRNFSNIFREKFTSEEEYLKQIERPLNYTVTDIELVSEKSISKEMLFVILASIFEADIASDKKVQIIVDESGDCYNNRCKKLLKAIYEYLPYTFRKKMGFTTYSGGLKEKGYSGRIKIFLYDESFVDKTDVNPDVIDLNTDLSVYESNFSSKVRQYVEYLLNLSEKERTDLWESIYKQEKKSGIFVTADYLNLFAIKKEWENSLPEKMLPIWIREVNKCKNELLLERMLGVIEKNLSNDIYNDYLQTQIEGYSLLDKKKWSQNAINCLKFGETVPSITIESEIFEDLLDKELREQNRKLKIISYSDLLDDESFTKVDMQLTEMQSNIKKLKIGDKKVEQIKQNLIKRIEYEKENLFNVRREKINLEANELEDEISKQYSILYFTQWIKELHLKFEKNEDKLKDSCLKKFTQLLEQQSIKTQYEEDKKQFIEYLEVVKEQFKWNVFIQEEQVTAKWQKIEEVRRLSTYTIKNRADIIKMARQLGTYDEVTKSMGYSKRGIILKLGMRTFELEESIFLEILDFAVNPTMEGSKKIFGKSSFGSESIVEEYPTLFTAMCETRFFVENHFYYVFSNLNSVDEYLEILEYYSKNGNKNLGEDRLFISKELIEKSFRKLKENDERLYLKVCEKIEQRPDINRSYLRVIEKIGGDTTVTRINPLLLVPFVMYLVVLIISFVFLRKIMIGFYFIAFMVLITAAFISLFFSLYLKKQ